MAGSRAHDNLRVTRRLSPSSSLKKAALTPESSVLEENKVAARSVGRMVSTATRRRAGAP